MKYTIPDLERFYENGNVRAFYMVMRYRESSLDDSAYRMVNGGPPITDFSKHPYEGLSTYAGGRAAGAPQFIPSTWGDLVREYGFPSFEPHYQDLGYVGRLIYRGALDLVMAGRFDEAVAACRKEWTSLPGASESRASWTLDKARDLYLRCGGGLSGAAPVETQEPAPIEEREVLPREETRMPIAALIAAFGPMIVEMIPTVAKLFDKKTDTPAKVDAVTKVMDTIVKATGTPNVQAAVEKMQSDPAALVAARNAVVTEPTIQGLLEIGGGIEKAAERNLTMQNATRSFLHNPAFWITLLLMLFPTMLLVDVFYIHMDKYEAELRTQIVTSVLGIILVVCGYWLGTSAGSVRKTDIIADQAGR